LELLPLEINGGIEAFRMLDHPDLRADQEVVRIQIEGPAPKRQRLAREPPTTVQSGPRSS
jgi:hypothetical protein